MLLWYGSHGLEVSPCCSLSHFYSHLGNKKELCHGLVCEKEHDTALALSFPVSLALSSFSISIIYGDNACGLLMVRRLAIFPAPETKEIDKPIKFKVEVSTLSVMTLKPHPPI